MLSRDQQKLLGSLGAGTVADALLDRIRDRDTFEGGRSAPQPGCWISYNRKAVRLEDHARSTPPCERPARRAPLPTPNRGVE